MALVRVPPNCGGMTLTTSGAVTPTAGVITCTVSEANSLVYPYTFQGSNSVQTTNVSTGATVLQLPTVITNITINGSGYAVTNGLTAPVPAADATAFIAGSSNLKPSFQLVTG